jgi:hypothetical protein
MLFQNNSVAPKTANSLDSQNGFRDLFNRTKALAPKMKLFQEISGKENEGVIMIKTVSEVQKTFNCFCREPY